MYNFVMILEILLPIPTKKTFFYKSKDEFRNIKVGTIVKVEFRNQISFGIIWKKCPDSSFSKPIKEIISIFENLCLPNEVIKSIDFISKYSCLSKSMVLKNFFSAFPNEAKLFVPKKEKLIKHRYDFYNNSSREQRNAIKFLRQCTLSKFQVILLHGVTGSGKTRVYLDKVSDCINKKLQCLIMVPEIILTDNWVKEIEEEYGIYPLVFHSSKKKSFREEIWKKAISGEQILVVGTRSALFLPFKDLGLIVVDEEHDSSYKQEDKLILNFRDFAIVRARNSGCPIVLSSATPSLESFYNYKIGKYKKINLKLRINDNPLPKINLIDMKHLSDSIISPQAENIINKNLKEKNQTLLFVNKRGYAPFVICKLCGQVEICENCNFPFVLHNFSKEKKPYLLCHHCNIKQNFTNHCNKCKSAESFFYPGIGIEKIYEEIRKKFDKAKISVISSDLIRGKKALKETLKKIVNNDIDIIIGTQLVSKGHNFPFLKTAIILNVDNYLNNIDFRSNEKTYQQIIQVAGRSGRKEIHGEVYIQSLIPKHPVIEMSQNRCTDNFLQWELNNRKINFLPPFSNYISLLAVGLDESKVRVYLKNIFLDLKHNFKEFEIYGPAPAVMLKKKSLFRYKVLIKLRKNRYNQNIIKNYLSKIHSDKKIKLYIDVDPINFL